MKMAIDFLDLPSEDGAFPWFCQRLPEAKWRVGNPGDRPQRLPSYGMDYACEAITICGFILHLPSKIEG